MDKETAHRLVAVLTLVLLAGPLLASDHADPIDPFRKERLEGGLTDLFVFPVKAGGEVAFPFQRGKHPSKPEGSDGAGASENGPYRRADGISLEYPDRMSRSELTAEEKAQIEALVVILCVRRQLTQTGSLRLEPYTYRIHMDFRTKVSFDDSDGGSAVAHPLEEGNIHVHDAASTRTLGGQEARARYGGMIQQPDRIGPNVSISIRLNNDASLNGKPIFEPGNALTHTDQIRVTSGVFDDPFIFPAFFGTNIVGIALRIPIRCFPKDQEKWIVWATSHKGWRQVDHVGRSLRTQNPRFELLNTLPPSEHVAALQREHAHPSLFRDLALRFNFQSLFAYREWDFVPDVLIYTNRFPVGFPNGRLLDDDVAAMAAQHGDTLLLELSHHDATWPRRTANDKPFHARFPYLAEPWPDRKPPEPPSLTRASKLKLFAIAVFLLALLVLENWLVARWYHRKRVRRLYL